MYWKLFFTMESTGMLFGDTIGVGFDDLLFIA